MVYAYYFDILKILYNGKNIYHCALMTINLPIENTVVFIRYACHKLKYNNIDEKINRYIYDLHNSYSLIIFLFV